MNIFTRRLGTFLLLGLLTTGAFVPPGYAQDDSSIEDNGTEINVKNADIAAIVRIFSNRTKRNYILDERVKGKVSIYLPGKVSSTEAIRILDSVLALKGFTSVPIGDNLWKIIPAQEAKQTTIPTVENIDGRGSAMMVTRLVSLKYVSSDDVQQLISPLISANGLVNAYTGTNSLIIIDSEENIKRISKIIDSIDLPYTDREMTIVPIEHAEAQDIADKIISILTDQQEEDSSGPPSSTDLIRARLKETSARLGNKAGTGAPATGSALTVAARAREPKIIADERTNSLIIVADEDTTLRIRALVSELDSPVNRSGSRFYVYRCQHASAEELAEVLAGLAGGDVNTRSSRPSIGDSSSRTLNRLEGQSRTPGRARSESQSDSNRNTSVSFGDDLSITADAATNSLIISGSKSEYEKIIDLLNQIDVKRRQVLVEAMILEVSVDDSVSSGMEFITSGGGSDGGVFAANNFGGLTQLLSDPTQLSQLSVAAASAGTLTLPGGISIPTQTVLLSAASSNTNVNVLSSPTILATDNEDAEIVVGRNVPFLASTATTINDLNNTFNQIDRQDVGITLRLNPQINSNNYVTMQIFTEVSDVIEATLQSDLGPTTTVRTSETTVVTKDGQMIVIGGLISDSQSESTDGVPYLKDIPVLGHAFRSKTNATDKTNLLIFITPRIIKDQFDARDYTKSTTGALSDSLIRDNIHPDRDDVLHNRNIDRVSEGEIYEGPKPGTIMAPSANNNEEFSVQSQGSTAAISPKPPRQIESDEIEVLELEAAPSIPDSDLPQPKISNTSSDDRASMGVVGPIENEDQAAASQYLVMQLQGATSGSTELPFDLTSSKVFGVMLPGEVSSKATSFFSTGEYYKVQTDNTEIPVRVLGSFDSLNETVEYYGELKDRKWYSLTAHEIMNLGQGPWIKAN